MSDFIFFFLLPITFFASLFMGALGILQWSHKTETQRQWAAASIGYITGMFVMSCFFTYYAGA